ncbi:HU family DNA-binding protein [Mycoplasma sp. 'Moose RK']|uniref:HU family DNA-binding protein n=1 Tax=Mycoplasma sp. 'Moose RK' TaxID=2780095 RepID=UPI0018C2E3BB|nr:HU family DNA-binding protein [Mycoplasma sp. 'Moose RK']MBG0730632.1 HU family DNA-binding protein [Mycoplasma sp. 'Moose RK']
MNKKELLERISKETKLQTKQVDQVLNEFVKVITEVVKSQDKLVINSFGTFQGVFKPSSTSFNPLTKSQITVKEKTIVKFKPSKVFKDTVA